MDVLHANKRMWTNTQHAHSYLKEHAYKHAQMRARTYTHTPTCTQGLGGTQARIVRVQKSYSVGNKFTHQNILLGSLHNSSSRLQRGA